MAKAAFKTWGDYQQQTVRRPRGDSKAPYTIRQGKNEIPVRPQEVDSLILALLCVRAETCRRRF